MTDALKRLVFCVPRLPIIGSHQCANLLRAQRHARRGFASSSTRQYYDNEADATLRNLGFEEDALRDIEKLADDLKREMGDLSEFNERIPMPVVEMTRQKREKEEDYGPLREFHGDDISSLAHAELQRHRELREYNRIAAWELPLLSKYAKPFELPATDEILRFRYTTYMGEKHPAENKVVVDFYPDDIPDLTAVQKSKLIKLCGPRYNPSNGMVKMSCEMFETQAQNKRYLGDTIDNLIAEAKDPKDTFEDVPFDFRHYKDTKKRRLESLRFPDAWTMTEERKAALKARREARLLVARKKSESGEVVDGQKKLEQSFNNISPDLELETLEATTRRRPRVFR